MWDEKLLLKRENSPVSVRCLHRERWWLLAWCGAESRSAGWAAGAEHARSGMLWNATECCRTWCWAASSSQASTDPWVWPVAEQLSLQAEASESLAWGKCCFDRQKPIQEELINSFSCCGIVDAAL